MKFVKLSAAGNDFILIDNRRGIFPEPPEGTARDLCRRRFSIGADGLILIENSVKADFSYRHFNSDGSEAKMCGNGARAAVRCMAGEISPENRLSFEIGGAVIRAEVRESDVRLHLPPPGVFRRCPGIVRERNLEEGGFITVGVPHFVVFSSALEGIDVDGIGRRFRVHSDFPEGTNVDFVRVTGSHSIEVRTYERGVEGETPACGTGTVASAIVAQIRKSVASPVRVGTSGGDLTVDWDDLRTGVRLTGGADIIYRGELGSGSSG